MSNKVLLEPSCPVTQSREAVVELLNYLGRTYRSGSPCKHQRKFFPAEKKPSAGVPEPVDSTIPTGEWPGGYNVPVEEALQEVA